MEEFLALRKRLHDALKRASRNHPGKMYEGEMSIEIHFPGIYDNTDKEDAVVIWADFYLIGPARHYSWKGETLKQAVQRASRDIDEWIDEQS